MTKSGTDLIGVLHKVWYHIIQNRPIFLYLQQEAVAGSRTPTTTPANSSSEQQQERVYIIRRTSFSFLTRGLGHTTWYRERSPDCQHPVKFCTKYDIISCCTEHEKQMLKIAASVCCCSPGTTASSSSSERQRQRVCVTRRTFPCFVCTCAAPGTYLVPGTQRGP